MTMEFDVIAAAWLFVAAAHALPPPPAPIRLTPEEEEALAEGGIVVRWMGPDRPTVAVVDVAAPPRRVMDAVMDLPPRVDEISGLRAVEIYREEPGRVAARWEMGVAVYQAHFHIDYAFDLDLGWSVYALDEGRDNDILASEGSYQVYAAGSGSRLVYRTTSRSKKDAPDWIRKKLALSSSREMLGGMRTRAEEAAR